ncbi:hypothetical protein [Nonomuraea sp. NEAU-A123]|uniref:hypothetical protein n=1 Tax=Nonomuraea sp. NEAU-A123 TaxID=2839649 RepID=UPI001BE45ED8|nr:hypothetical protein [Nonomuraea sp. NEAU-A123]MBT2231782.1 hypothetical protein [Nonomuraea sp. NEAU-A123]
MQVRAAARGVAAAAVLGVVFGMAPTAMAWGSTGYTSASCWRPWLSSTATFGGNGANYTSLPGGGRIDFYIKVDAYLKHKDVDTDSVRGEGTGQTSPRKDHGGVVGDGSWVVWAYGWDNPSSPANQKINSCVIT